MIQCKCSVPRGETSVMTLDKAGYTKINGLWFSIILRQNNSNNNVSFVCVCVHKYNYKTYSICQECPCWSDHQLTSFIWLLPHTYKQSRIRLNIVWVGYIFKTQTKKKCCQNIYHVCSLMYFLVLHFRSMFCFIQCKCSMHGVEPTLFSKMESCSVDLWLSCLLFI